jgi:thiol-disulfide isomerase/thioredoxin
MVGLLFGADWCKPCLKFIPVLDRLYSVQAARGAHRLEIVLVLHCREAKATKYYGLGMLWLAMYHNADNEVGMNTRTTALMAKFGVTTIPALILLDQCRQVICAEGRGWCVADPKGLAFPWRGKTTVGPVAQAVVSFDLPLGKQGQQPEFPARIL